MNKVHAILRFFDGLIDRGTTNVVQFCSHDCCKRFTSNLIDMRRRNCSTMVERFVALKFNETKRCPECEKNI